MSKSDWKKIIESKIDKGWTDLDIGNIAAFVGNEVEVMFKNEDDIWITIWNNKPEIVKWMLEGSEIRYKLKLLETIDVTVIEKLADGNIECTKKDGSKFLLILDNGRD